MIILMQSQIHASVVVVVVDLARMAGWLHGKNYVWKIDQWMALEPQQTR